ncbi:hypothetical protein G2583_4236 [Escherichia coli O55:H7 str. CB9615]|nr:hypothetical protein G2583_4236 [Escherichia coli O55:H7 str. CB9615]EKK63580.1 hypothetical protein EC100869_4525 [Escherichia coli 10.0869]STH37995.1 Uncharacterised protein [Escherichia coli]
MLRQLTFLLPTKFHRGKKLRTQRYRGLQSKEKKKLSLLTTKFSDEAWGDNHKNKVVYRAQDRFHNPLFIVLMVVKKKLDHKKLIDNNSHYHVCI